MTAPGPRIGEILYLDTKGEQPVEVVHREGTFTAVVPLSTNIIRSHQGNFCDKDGNYPYTVPAKYDG